MMKAKVRHLFEMISGAILSLLGLSSCGKFENIAEPAGAYGSLHATFKVTGEVKAADSSKPIEGIVVQFSREDDGGGTWETAKFKSDKEGKVDGLTHAWPSDKDIMLTFEDIDGEENGGQFAPDTLRAKDLQIKFVENPEKGWNKGVYYITFEKKLKKAGK
jgi:putative lipoprotein (rSAM/lipoprotein system)